MIAFILFIVGYIHEYFWHNGMISEGLGKLDIKVLEVTHPYIINQILKETECFYWRDIVFVKRDIPIPERASYTGCSHYITFRIECISKYERFNLKNIDKYRKFAVYYESKQYFIDHFVVK